MLASIDFAWINEPLGALETGLQVQLKEKHKRLQRVSSFMTVTAPKRAMGDRPDRPAAPSNAVNQLLELLMALRVVGPGSKHVVAKASTGGGF